MELTHQLTPQLKHLRLSGILESLEVRHRQAIDNKWSHIEFLEHLLQDEVERRGQKQLHLRLRRATLNTTKTLETFDFAFNPTLNRQQLLALATGDYIRDKRNVILCGPTGVGKSHLSQALGQEACRRGFDVLFINAYKMLQYLNGGRADGSLDRRLKTFLRPDLLILDDFGLKPLQSPAPSDLYDVISERYEKGSLLLTSNRPPVEWPGLFGDPLLAAAGIDRLCHRAEIIIMRGQSFRAQNRQPVGGEEPAGGQRNG
jgi:DNA replication protein DnaC